MSEMTTRDVARELGISQVTVRKQFNAGRLTGRRISSSGSGWSVLLIDSRSVQIYRQRYLGRPGRKGTR